jgi:F5/8 type C domain-containing protein
LVVGAATPTKNHRRATPAYAAPSDFENQGATIMNLKFICYLTAAAAAAVWPQTGLGAPQQPTVQARAVRPAAVMGDLIDITRANDGMLDTRAASDSAQYAGSNLILDVGGEQNIIGVIQDHGRWPTHYPGAYKVEVASSASGPWLRAGEERGNRGESKILFEAVRARFIRVTATQTGGGGPDWTVAEIKAIIDPGARPRQVPPEPTRPTRDQRGVSGSLRDVQLVIDRDPATRATSGTADYAGMSLTFDLGGEYEISRVVQLHGQWRDDYPGDYKVEVSRRKDESEFREVWRGRGAPDRSVANFYETATRYVRITALRARDRVHAWSIAELRTNRDEQDVVEHDAGERRVDRTIHRVTAQGLSNITAAVDEDLKSNASTDSSNYIGSWVQADLGGSYTVSRVLQIHNPDNDFPGRYRIELSEDGRRWQTVWEGEGEPARSRANFDPQRARYVRLTATGKQDNRHRWSISGLRISG